MLTAANRDGVSFQGFSPQGLAADEGIIQVALENQADLIIMGSHGRTGYKRAAPGQRHRTGHRPGPLPGPGGQEEIVFGFLFSVFRKFSVLISTKLLSSLIFFTEN